MIYTVTFNPAVDCVVRLPELQNGETNRADSEEIYFGGKGINVSVVLQRLGLPSTALGFTAGFTGEAIEKEIKNEGVLCDFIRLENGFSRINIKIKSGGETEINADGPEITKENLNGLFLKLKSMKDGDTLVLSGSIPKTVPDDIYENILSFLSEKDIRIIVDATGKLLINVLKYKPFLIKPNLAELSEIFNTSLGTDEEIIFYAEKLKELGAENVIVSMGERGSVLIDANGKTHFSPAAKGELINSVGAGDSMIAGFIAGLSEKNDYSFALKKATACGGATAFSNGLCDKKTVDEVFNTL